MAIQDRGQAALHLAHGAVGLQHATMAIYNAWCDQVPVYMVIGNVRDVRCAGPASNGTTPRRTRGDLVRDYVKWDDYPASLEHFAEFERARLQIHHDAADASGADRRRLRRLQENPIPEDAKLRIPKLPQVALRAGRSGAVADTARCSSWPSSPVLIADRYARTRDGLKHLVELAELLQCAMIDTSGRLNCRPPSAQPVSRARGDVAQADASSALR